MESSMTGQGTATIALKPDVKERPRVGMLVTAVIAAAVLFAALLFAGFALLFGR